MIEITEQAREKLNRILDEEDTSVIRFGLKGGGCTGFQYFFGLEEFPADDDNQFEIGDGRVLVVDPMSSMYLEGSTIDYKKDLMGESFVFNNPNTTTKCGCGSSVGF